MSRFPINLARLEYLVYAQVDWAKLDFEHDKGVVVKSFTRYIHDGCLVFMNQYLEDYVFENTDVDSCIDFKFEFDHNELKSNDNELLNHASIYVTHRVFNNLEFLKRCIDMCVSEYLTLISNYSDYPEEHPNDLAETFDEDLGWDMIFEFLSKDEVVSRILGNICYLCEIWDMVHFSVLDHSVGHHKYVTGEKLSEDIDSPTGSSGNIFYYEVGNDGY